MDLVERYLQSVRFWLPRKQQDDVAAELGDDIRSQIEDQEVQLGRKLTELEVASLLKERGRPMLVANRYRPQQYLIGPALFPTYRFVLMIIALCYLVPWILAWWGFVIFDPRYHADFSGAFVLLSGAFWVTGFIALGVVTAVFAILERLDSRMNFLRNWDPLKLPAARDPQRIPRLNSAIDLAANLAFGVWWATDMWSATVFNRGEVRIVFAPVWRVFWWTLLVFAIADVVLQAANLLRPYWSWLRASMQLAVSTAACAWFCAFLKANIFLELAVPNLSAEQAKRVVNIVNTGASRLFPMAVAVCILIVALSGVRRLVRLRGTRKRIIERVAA